MVTNLQEKLHFIDFAKGYGLVKDYTRLYVTLENSELAEIEIRDNVHFGYIVSLIFVAIMFVTFCCAPNFYMLFRHFSQNEPLATPKTDWAY